MFKNIINSKKKLIPAIMAHNLLYSVDGSYLSAALITHWFSKNAPNYKDSFISLEAILKLCN